MAGQEFLRLCREVMETYRKGHGLCLEIQSGLNDDYRNGRISYEEWERRTDENESRKATLRAQFDLFSDRLDRMKKD